MITRFLSDQAQRIRRWLASGKLPPVLACMAIALTIQSVGTGLQFDDYIQREIILKRLERPAADAAVTGMFSFAKGDPERTRSMMELGLAPWWTFENIRVAFWRPVTEITHWLDYQLWPDSPALMHIHSLLWFGLLIFVVTHLYRKLMQPGWAAGLAALLYAIDDSHGMAVAWIAGRNGVIAAVFGIITLIVHDRWRRDGWKAGAIVGPMCLLLGLLSAEAALATGAYLFSYEIFLARGSLRRKTAGLLPYAVVTACWWVAYHQLGFGAWGSGNYLDPGQEPLLYLRALGERIPILLYGQWLFPQVGIYQYLPEPLAHRAWLAAIVFLAVLVLLFIPLVKRNVTARFWAVGMILAVLPICATSPDNRLLFFVGLGAMGLLAQFLAGWFDQAAWLPAMRIWRGLAWVFAILFVMIHGVLAPLTLPGESIRLAGFSEKAVEMPVTNLPDEENIAGKTLVFVNPPAAFFVTHTRYIRSEHGLPLPAHIRILASGMTPRLEIARVGERSLELQPQGGFLSLAVDKLFRGAAHPMRVGQRVEFSDMTVEVLSQTEDQLPLRARFTFAQPLEDPSYLFVVWKRKRFVSFTLPAVGESVRLPWVSPAL